MRIKLDENLPADLAEVLAEKGHDVDISPRDRQGVPTLFARVD